MATVFVTFFLITQFHVYEMDADYMKRRRESEKSLREKRWSMNSQRLEEIVAELMKPISDVRRSFDTDLSALLEEYLTEAGLRALEEGEEEGTNGSGDAAPNFAELALLLQQSACIYSRKVDFLYQHVLDVSDSLHNSTLDTSTSQPNEPQTPSSRRKRRKSSAAGAGEFCSVELTGCAGARRDGPARPPPTLPRGYLELEPRVLHDADAPLLDYAGEPIGLITDFQVTWRLQDGLLVDELQVADGASGTGACAEGGGRLRAVPLAELQAAIAAAAPPDLPPPPPSPEPEPEPPPPDPSKSSHQPAEPRPPPQPTPEPLACSTPRLQAKRERKRRSDVRLEEVAGVGKMLISAEMREKLARLEEFALPRAWITRVVRARKDRVLSARRRLRAIHYTELRGFDVTDSTVIGGFAGWSLSEAACATGEAGALARRPRADSDDDGFFEQSSTGDSDDSAALNAHTALPALPALNTQSPAVAAQAALEGSPDWVAWRDAVVERATAAAARGFNDVRAAGDTVLRAAADLAPRASGAALLASTARHPTDVSRMFLATLFLANAGNLEIEQGAPLSLNSFSVRLLSSDQRLYRAAAAADCADLER